MPSERVPGLCDLVAWAADLDGIFAHLNLLPDHANREACNTVDFAAAFTLFARCAAGEIGLVFAALGVCKVGAIVLVDSQTETALEAAYVVFEEVGIFIEVDGLKGKTTKPFTTICVCG